MSEKNNDSKALDNFILAWSKFEEFLDLPVVDDRDKAGIIQAYEFTIETAWKALRKMAQIEGEITNTPRDAIFFGIKTGIIDQREQQTWLDMLYARNLTSHIYSPDLSDKILGLINESYRSELKKIAKKVKEAKS